ncbi:hypothetical protein [Planotetraspora sp. GP83]|uniref:hypothetical protein n=1 Tax=Planotetraspora sp. GP83 TaxID=3156264 RepID=UPI003512F77F
MTVLHTVAGYLPPGRRSLDEIAERMELHPDEVRMFRRFFGFREILYGFRIGGVARPDEMAPAMAARLMRTADHRRAVAAFAEHGPDHVTSYDGE